MDEEANRDKTGEDDEKNLKVDSKDEVMRSFLTKLLLTRCAYFFGLVILIPINIPTHNSY